MQGPLYPSAPVPLSQISPTPSQKRCVTFSCDVEVRPYYTKSLTMTKGRLWYSPEELRQQQISNMQVIYMVRYAAASYQSLSDDMAYLKVVDCLSDHSTWCIRGLEPMLDGGKRRAQNKLRGVLAVLLEQGRQIKERDGDENQIVMRYQGVAHKCQKEAHHRAMRDRAAVYKPSGQLSKETSGIDMSSAATNLSELSSFLPQTMSSRAA